jgi:hypothetical protein
MNFLILIHISLAHYVQMVKEIHRSYWVAVKNSKEIMVLKWHDKRDITLPNTCHSNQTPPQQPQAVKQ